MNRSAGALARGDIVELITTHEPVCQVLRARMVPTADDHGG